MLANNYGGYCDITNFFIQHGKNGSWVNGTKYNISTANTNGSPVITYIDKSPQGILYNLDRLLVSETYRIFFPISPVLAVCGITGAPVAPIFVNILAV